MDPDDVTEAVVPAQLEVLPMGDRALLVELADLASVIALHAALETRRRAGDGPVVEDLVPAERTLLVRFDPRLSPPGVVTAWLRTTEPAPAAVAGPELVEVPVHYDGPDLDDVARLTGLDPAGVVAAHTGTDWTVAFSGFAPGFGYLVGGDPRLRVPRMPTPRLRVPAGAVGLAGDYSGVYPRSSPGGWRLIGRTEARLWDPDARPPALLRPGVRVRFVAMGWP